MAFLWIGIGGLLLLALLGGSRHQELGWAAAWVVAAVALGWGVFGWLRARRMKHALPFAPGTYVFATEVIVAEDAKCFQQDFDTLKHVRLHAATGAGGIPEAQIEWDFPGETVSLRVPSQQIAQRLLGQIQAVRDRLAQAMAAGAWENVHALDPLYEARYGGGWEQVCPPVVLTGARGAGGWFGLPVPVVRAGLLAGMVAGAALWFGSNLLRDGMAFRSAQSVNTPAAWRNFLKRPESAHHAEVRRRILPAAALRAALKEGGAEALRNVAIEFGDSSAAAEVREALEKMSATAESKALAEVEPQARPALQGMFRWLREHGTAEVEVRFGESSEAWLGSWDDYLKAVQQLQTRRREIAPIAASFSPAVARRREDAIVSALRQGFQNLAPSDVVNLRKGRVFSGEPMGFAKPALAVQVAVNPIGETLNDATQDRLYLKLDFNFKVALTVPGVPAWNFELPVNPGDLLDGAPGGSLYDRMADIAYQELHQRLAAAFFPHHAPERTIKLATTAGGRTERTVAASSGARYSATGFFISPQGHLVTARHFTRKVHDITVATKSGLLPAKLVREDEANDLALLKVEGAFKALPIQSSASAKLLDKVSTCGFPNIDVQGKEVKATEGTINGLKGAGDDPRHFQISAQLHHGNSGGPLLDARGNVVGVVIAGLNPSATQNVNYAVKSDELLKFLAKFPELTNRPPPAAAESPNPIDRALEATVLLEGAGN